MLYCVSVVVCQFCSLPTEIKAWLEVLTELQRATGKGPFSTFRPATNKRGRATSIGQEGCQQLLGEGRNLCDGNFGYLQPWHLVFQFMFLKLILQQVARMFGFFSCLDKITLC